FLRRPCVSHAKRSIVQRSQRDGVRQSVLFRSDVSRGKIENAAALVGILDGGTRMGIRHARRLHECGGTNGVVGRANSAARTSGGIKSVGARYDGVGKNCAAVP